MIRITTQKEEGRTVVTIDGWLATSDLKELRRIRKPLDGPVVLNLAGLEATTDEGVRALREWLDAGAQLNSATPFLRMLLENKNGGCS